MRFSSVISVSVCLCVVPLYVGCGSTTQDTPDSGNDDAGDGAAEVDANTSKGDSGSSEGCVTSTPCTNSSQCVAIAGTTCNTTINKCQKVLCANEGESCSEKDHCKEGACVDDKCSTAKASTGDYLAFCMPFLVVANPAQTLRFHAIVGTAMEAISMSVQPLMSGATSIDKTVGSRFPSPATSAKLVGANAVLSFGTTPTIPANANPITGTDISVENLRLNVTLTNGATDFCATMDGTVRPSGTVIDPAKSACLFKKVTSSTAAIAVPPFADFHCP